MILRVSMVALLACFASGCGGDSGGSGDDDDNVSSENCTSQWDCVNGACECADGSSCSEPDCDADCEVCD
jgi:hypothetical protein